MALATRVTRRQALAAAVAAGVGVGAVRLLGGTLANLRQAPAQGAVSGSDWNSPLGAESARVMQLLRRTTLGHTPSQLEAGLSAGFDKTVDRLVETPPGEPPPLAAAATPRGRFNAALLQERWVAQDRKR